MKTSSKLATPAGHTSTATSSMTMSQVRTTVESEMAMLNDRYIVHQCEIHTIHSLHTESLRIWLTQAQQK